MAFKMKGFSGFKDTPTDKMMSLLPKPKINKLPAERKKPRKKPVNAVGVRGTKKSVRPSTPKTNNRPKFQGTDQNKSIVQQAPSQFQKDLKKIAKKTFDSNPVVQGVKVLKKFGKKTGLTKDIKKKSKKVKNYFGYYN